MTPAQLFIKRLDDWEGGCLAAVDRTTVRVRVPLSAMGAICRVATILRMSPGDALWDRVAWMFDKDEVAETLFNAEEDARKRRE